MNNFSYLPKEIKLSQGNVSDLGDLFGPDAPEMDYEKKPVFSFLKSLSHIASDIDEKESLKNSIRIYKHSNSDANSANLNPDEIPSVKLSDKGSRRGSHNFELEVPILEERKESPPSPAQAESKFFKNEGKLVFKIIRIDRVTRKEKK